MRNKPRLDENQNAIVKALRKIGVKVESTASLGNGRPDFIAANRGKIYWFEVKNPDMPPSKRELTKDEQRFHWEWEGYIDVIESLDDALSIMGITK